MAGAFCVERGACIRSAERSCKRCRRILESITGRGRSPQKPGWNIKINASTVDRHAIILITVRVMRFPILQVYQKPE